MQVCEKCVLDENFPGARLNETGLCQYCRKEGSADQRREEKEGYQRKFERILEKTRDKGSYDVLMALSGGKDSTYTLKLLRDMYDLRVLAVSFDHGFVSPQAMSNIRNSCDRLNVDLLVFSPDRSLLGRSFLAAVKSDAYGIKALERASAICNTCMHIAKSFFLKTAIEMGIPVMAYGWSPGQAPLRSSVLKLNSGMVKQSQGVVGEIFKDLDSDGLCTYLLKDRHHRMLTEHLTDFGGSFLYNVHPLAYMDYDEDRIMDELTLLGWSPPEDTDANSTNCLLNSYANKVHIDRHGFHPYAFEIAGLVRDGFMNREEGIRRLSEVPDEEIVAKVENKLNSCI